MTGRSLRSSGAAADGKDTIDYRDGNDESIFGVDGNDTATADEVDLLNSIESTPG